uniref:Uncharacterized protein n=1 Tax=Haptolina brevifila TaxID=156173 RepID=A0A6U7DGM2_9EUKA|mmetsp:Transcript_25159/g.50574  ORF Transcript_25159/g.50574 Transcript_25159/m.50574 type:complete len:164 (+) Transcript_25159:192-683(+)
MLERIWCLQSGTQCVDGLPNESRGKRRDLSLSVISVPTQLAGACAVSRLALHSPVESAMPAFEGLLTLSRPSSLSLSPSLSLSLALGLSLSQSPFPSFLTLPLSRRLRERRVAHQIGASAQHSLSEASLSALSPSKPRIATHQFLVPVTRQLPLCLRASVPRG